METKKGFDKELKERCKKFAEDWERLTNGLTEDQLNELLKVTEENIFIDSILKRRKTK